MVMHECGTELTAVSLFDGIGGFPHAFAGIARTVATCEIDPAAAGVAADHFPEAKAFTDVTELTADELLAAGFCPTCGVITAGWPCQGNSMAGRRGGMKDPRSGLWKEIVRLLRALQPAWFVGENVPGLLSVNKGEDMRIIMSDLESSGYLVELDIYDAQFFGVPQRRRRVVLTCRSLARLLERKTTSSALTLAQCLTEISLLSFLVQSQEYGKGYAPWVSHEACADGLLRRMRQFGMQQEQENGWTTWLPILAGESARQALASGISDSRHGGIIAAALGSIGTDTSSSTSIGLETDMFSGTESSWRRFLDDLCDLARSSITSRPTSWITTRETFTSAQMLLSISAYTAALTVSCPSFSRPASSASTAIGALTNYVGSTGRSLFAAMDWVYDIVELGPAAEDLQRALGCIGDGRAPAAVLLEPDGGTRDPAPGGTPETRPPGGIAVSALQGGGRRGYRIDAEGAAGGHLVTTALTRNGILGGEVTHALTAAGSDASEDGTGRGTPIVAFGHTNGLDEQASESVTPTLQAGHGVGGGSVATSAAVRRLTPVECERLQGYPDNWTATSNGRPQSDSARYRQLGNSIAGPVFAWVARRLVADHRRLP